MENLLDHILNNWDNTLRDDHHPNIDLPHTAIILPYPYTSPSIDEHFSALYYWDTYFTNVGLLLSDKLEYAKNNAQNIAFMIEKYGYMPNGNRTVFIGRSQPPFFSMMVYDIYDRTKDKVWLKEMYGSIAREYAFWQTERTTETGLNTYAPDISALSEERIYQLADSMLRRTSADPPSDKKQVCQYAASILSLLESGWDCTSRFGLRPTKYNWVELNALLYAIEDNMAFFAKELCLSQDNLIWSERKELRCKLINEYLYDETAGMFCDYDFEFNKKSSIFSVASFYPLFVGLATDEQAKNTRHNLFRIEQEYGISASEPIKETMDLQWDYPHGWACLNYIVVNSLLRYGYDDDAYRIAKKYVNLLERNFDSTGGIWEKYDVVTGEPSISKENATKHTMMGWTAGVYVYFKKALKI